MNLSWSISCMKTHTIFFGRENKRHDFLSINHSMGGSVMGNRYKLIGGETSLFRRLRSNCRRCVHHFNLATSATMFFKSTPKKTEKERWSRLRDSQNKERTIPGKTRTPSLGSKDSYWDKICKTPKPVKIPEMTTNWQTANPIFHPFLGDQLRFFVNKNGLASALLATRLQRSRPGWFQNVSCCWKVTGWCWVCWNVAWQ